MPHVSAKVPDWEGQCIFGEVFPTQREVEQITASTGEPCLRLLGSCYEAPEEIHPTLLSWEFVWSGIATEHLQLTPLGYSPGPHGCRDLVTATSQQALSSSLPIIRLNLSTEGRDHAEAWRHGPCFQWTHHTPAQVTDLKKWHALGKPYRWLLRWFLETSRGVLPTSFFKEAIRASTSAEHLQLTALSWQPMPRSLQDHKRCKHEIPLVREQVDHAYFEL